MAKTKRVQLEVREGEEAFVRTLAGKLGWNVIMGGEGERAQQEDAEEPGWRWRGGDEPHDAADVKHDSTQQAQGAAGDTQDSADLSRYSPTIQALRRRLYTKITPQDIASDARLAYILSK